jgi:hypothetical protein
MLLAKRSNAILPENTKAVYKTKVLMGESVGEPGLMQSPIKAAPCPSGPLKNSDLIVML